MKLTYLLFNVYGIGGTVRTVASQANAMAARGHDVEIVSLMRYRDNPPFPVDDRVKIITMLDSRTGTHVDWDGMDGDQEDTSWHSRFPASISDAPEKSRRLSALIRFLPTIRDRILITTKPQIDILAERYSSPDLVRVVQEHTHYNYHNAEWRALIDAEQANMDAIVCLTETDRAEHVAAAGDRLRIERIPNALHSLDVPRSDLSRKIVVAAGRLDPAKGFDLLIEAFTKVIQTHPDWTLRIYGHGPEEKRLRKMVLDQHLYNHVFIMGPATPLDDHLAKGSIFALSSRSEGFGMVLLEAMNCGVPPVAFDCPVGPRELLRDGINSLRVPEQDVNALAAGINRLIEDEALRAGLADGALKTAAEYGPEPVAEAWERLFEDLLAQKQGKQPA